MSSNNNSTPLRTPFGGEDSLVSQLLRLGISGVGRRSSPRVIEGTVHDLHAACLNNNVELVRYFVEDLGLDPNALDIHGYSPLYGSCLVGSDDVVLYLLSQGADPNFTLPNGVGPLYIACEKNFPLIVKTLLHYHAQIDQPTSNGATPLFIASQNGHEEIVEVLLASGANVRIARVSDNTPLCDGATPLHIACFEGHLNVVDMLLLSDAEVNRPMSNTLASPLFLATARRHYDIAKELLIFRADVNQRIVTGETPLYTAAQLGYPEFVELFIAAGAEYQALVPCHLPSLGKYILPDSEQAPSHVAQAYDKQVVACPSHDRGSLPTREDDSSHPYVMHISPVTIAAKNGHANIVKIFMKHDFPFFLCESALCCALALEGRHVDVVRLYSSVLESPDIRSLRVTDDIVYHEYPELSSLLAKDGMRYARILSRYSQSRKKLSKLALWSAFILLLSFSTHKSLVSFRFSYLEGGLVFEFV